MDIQEIINKIYEQVKKNSKGKVAAYIPELAEVNPNIFGICFMDCNENIYKVGNTTSEIAIESISKLFTFAKAVNKFGKNILHKKIGAHGSSLPFNSVMAEVLSPSHTINPFVNQGAIATTSLFYKKNKDDFKKDILDNLDLYANRKLRLGKRVYHSESKTNATNMGLAYLLKSYGRFYGNVDSSVDVYTLQCSKLVNAVDLARMACVFAKGGVHPSTGKRILNEDNVKFIIRTLRPEGLYEYSDIWGTNTGCVSAKSGVGGGILIILPGIGGIGIVSPPLDKYGNSVRGIISGRKLSNKLMDYFNNRTNYFKCKTNKKSSKSKNNITKKI